jgi:PTH1 family peptidyl-tRNA hydrolase
MPVLIIGLGNFGSEYAHTRHNVGWMCLDEVEHRGSFARSHRDGPARVRVGTIDGYDVVTARPQTYMNLSGRAGAHLTERYSVTPRDVIVVHDEADFPLGKLQIRRKGSSAGHKGVQSLIDAWRTNEFIRVRIGVGRTEGDDLVDHVLDTFTKQELTTVERLIARGADAIVAIIRDGVDAAMGEYNRAAAP